MSVTRTRWAAVGAAVAITLGAGGIGLVDAAKGSGERAVYTAIEPCRLLDTRPNQNIQRNTPLGEGETYDVTAIGDNGQCEDIPADTVALELNVTGLLNTAATDFVVWSGAGAAPNASHINLALGAPPTPNSVTTELDGNSFSIRNKFGNAHVIVDIVGVYQDHHHDDRYYTETEVDAKVDLTKFLSINVYSDPEIGSAERWANLADAGVGGLNTAVDFNFTVPPDFTPGSPVEIRVLAYARDATTFPCNGDLEENWLTVMRADVGRVPPGSPRLDPVLNDHIFAEPDVPHEFVFTTNPTLQLQPGDTVGFGLFGYAPATRCSLVITGVGVHYS